MSSNYSPIFQSSWNKTDLYSICDWVNGLAFKKINFEDSGKYPIIKINELKYGITSQTAFTNQLFDKSYFLTKGDLLFSWSGSPDTSIDVFWYTLKDGWLNQHIFKITPTDKVSKEFVFYLLKYIKPEIIRIAKDKQTTGLGHITKGDMKQLVISYPSKKEQARIVSILKSLDDKIELNRQTIQNIQTIAQAIFKEWFVDFNFPGTTGEMEESELGKIPKGWKIGRLRDVCLNFRKSVQPKELKKSLPYLGLEHIQRKNLSIPEWGSSSEVDSQKFLFSRGDILFGKLRPYFHKVGIAPVDGICSTDILVIRSLEKEFYSLVVNHLFDEKLINHVSVIADGTRMPRVDWNSIAGYQIIIPEKSIAQKFDKTVDKFYELMFLSIEENQTLTQLRDSLLPKLMKGEIVIK